MSLAHQIQKVFGIPLAFIKINAEDEALCLVHKSWLSFLRNGQVIPQEIREKETIDDTSLAFFFASKCDQQHSSWKLLTVHRWNKYDAKVQRFPKPHEEFLSVAVNLSYSQLINYITKANYKNLWEQAWRKYHTTDYPKRARHKQEYSDALREILKRLCKCQHTVREDGVIIFRNLVGYISADKKVSNHPNLLDVMCAVEENESFLLLSFKNACTLWDCLMFSSFIFNSSTIRPLFVIYQLLQAIRCVHNQGLFMGPITLSDISVNENLWIQAVPCTWKVYHKSHRSYLENQNGIHKQLQNIECDSNKSTSISQESAHEANLSVLSQKENYKTNNSKYLSSLVQGWVDGNISNYDYLLELNKLAGRKLNNPHCHYVMPWIMDFSVPEGGWRDLTKSKFRLNKGDKQLDLIYESSIEAVNTNTSHNFSNVLQVSAVTVPHHTSEVLTDITYYVYKARRMPKTFLCQHVRPKWVPAEYPSTIERLQEWTPDECIPEFFSDPEIFYSIHPDLSDLGVPWWCDDPEDFIKKHREALEGYHVSERLHHWIDLVFGYKLTGTSALKSKNICLPLVDDHTTVHNHGMVQLFAHPHPHKLSRSLFSRSLAPKTFRSITLKVSDAKDSGDDDTSSESLGKPSFLKGLRSKPTILNQDLSRWEPRPENQTIVLPKDFNPLAALMHFESLFSFLSWAGGESHNKSEIKCSEVSDALSYAQVQDLTILGCLFGEIAAFSQCKTLSQNVLLEDRYNNCLKLLRMHKQEIPRSLQSGIQLLLQPSSSYTEQSDFLCNVPNRYPPVTNWGLPFPSPHQLLIPSIPIIPFPVYFPELYSFLYELNNFSKEISLLCEEHDENSDFHSKIESIAERKVCFAAEQLLKLLPVLNSEAVELLIPYIQEMFQNQHTALLATWHLFGIIAQALGPQQTCKHLLKYLTKVFNTDRPSPKHLKLFHRTFLLQLIVGLGLYNFLMHFTTILIEAIGGCKDYSVQDTKSGDIYLQKPFPSDTNKLSCMSEDIEDCLTDDGPYDDSFLRSKALSQEGVHFQSEINNEEDNEIFDLDVNEEVLKENDAKESFNQSVHQKEKTKNEEEIEVDSSFPSISGDVDDCNEIDNSNMLSAESWNAFQDSTYSQSAPASTSHLSDWNTLSGEATYKSENIESHSKPRINEERDELTVNSSQTELGQDYNVSDVSAESMLWLAHRLGPVLTARYLTRNLLRMLTLCYDSLEKRAVVTLLPGSKEGMLSISCKWLKGDLNAFKVLDCLSRIASLYGEQFIMLQYIKHIADLLNLCKKRIPASLESGLLGAMALLQHIVPYVSDSVLMDYLQDIIIKDILLLILRLISSLRIAYPSGGKSRTMIMLRMLDVIYTIGLRIGFEMSRKHLSVVLQKFFSCFDKVYNERCEYKELEDILGNSVASSSTPLKQQALEEMRQTFTPEVAFLTYIPFCKLTGGIHMEKMLKNDGLIRNLCLIHDKNMQLSSQHPLINGNKATTTHMTHHRDHSLGQDDSFVSGVFGKNVNVIGNRLDVHLGDESHLVMGTVEPLRASNLNRSSKLPDVPKYDISLIKRKMDNCYRHLKGNWLAYWEHETGRSEKDYHFDFKQIKLQTFVGHSGTVRTIQVLDNENSFLTSSKDKTVKLWSLRSCGDGSTQIPCQWTYTQHRKSVFAVSFLDSLRLVGSCDSTVHIWDPFLGSCIKQLEPSKGSPTTVLTAMPAPSMTFLAATTNSTIKFLDARTCRYMHEFKVSVGTTGLIRCLAISPNGNWLAVGHSTGMLSVLDIRTGLLIGTWLGHEGEVLQLKPFNNSFFVSSSLDHGLTVWKYEDTQAKCHLKGPMEPVTSLCFYGNEVISGTTGNRVGVHSSIDKKASFNSTRLRSDTFKGMLTSMALLPLNRLLLLGTDNGNVVLLS